MMISIHWFIIITVFKVYMVALNTKAHRKGTNEVPIAVHVRIFSLLWMLSTYRLEHPWFMGYPLVN